MTAPTTVTTIDNRQVGTEDIALIRDFSFQFEVFNCKPNTRLYPFFDGIKVDAHVQPLNGLRADHLITDTNGALRGTMHIPGGTFRTGQRVFMLNEHPNPDTIISGMAVGQVSAVFTSNGIRQIFQRTITNTTTLTVIIDVPAPPPAPAWWGDPIAQTFDTMGITDGCYLHSIEVFFREKGNLPITCFVRKVVNGYPSLELVNPTSFKVLNPESVNVSANASVPTVFQFDDLVYLAPDQEYAFVLFTNSRDYYVYTAELGKTSIETGRIVFDQSHLGSMFRSQNNSTWTPSQFEDLKFRLNICEFDISQPAILRLDAESTPYNIKPEQFTTQSGSNIVTFRSFHKHGLDLNSHIFFAFDTRGTYNGIPGANLNGAIVPTSIVDEYTITFAATSNANRTGVITTGGFVNAVYVDNGGINYNPANTTITISGDGTGATGVPVIEDGKIIAVRITNAGSGYTRDPIVTVTSSSGSGAVIVASIYVMVYFHTNNLVHRINPAWNQFTPGNTKITNELRTRLATFPGSGVSNYTVGRNIDFTYGTKTELNQNTLLASRYNNTRILNGASSSSIDMMLHSDNRNISPIINQSNLRVQFEEYHVNNQFDENPLATVSGGSVISGTIVTAGAGYIGPISATVVSVDGNGSGATVSLTVAGGAITGITITAAGSGYTTAPRVVITGQSPSQVAAINLNLSEFNTELRSNSGRALARYLTRPQRLLEVARGSRVILNCYSSINTSVDVYFKGSQSSSSVPHDDHSWVLMSCDIERNRSTTVRQFHDYTFELDDFPGGYDVFQYKIVLKSRVPFEVPIINNMRAITLL